MRSAATSSTPLLAAGFRACMTSIIEPCASPIAAMKAPSSGPNGWHRLRISSANTSATWRGSRAGVETWWITESSHELEQRCAA
jgi:hypothetical protein